MPIQRPSRRLAVRIPPHTQEQLAELVEYSTRGRARSEMGMPATTESAIVRAAIYAYHWELIGARQEAAADRTDRGVQ